MNNPDAQHCLEKAAECDRRAEQAIDDGARDSYLRMAENGRLLAETHKSIRSVQQVQAARTII
jgi:hypothetical protein